MASWLGGGAACGRLLDRLRRTKPLGAMAAGPGGPTEAGAGLAEVLTTADLVSLGAGSCVGTGMYVVAGLVARATAGPGVILSFLVAAVASVLSGVCYAELGVRAPRTSGSAYSYAYVTVGELAAFLIGWNLILEYLIGTAAGAAALSSMFDALANHSLSGYTAAHLGTLPGLGGGEDTPPDPLALLIALLVTAVVALGARNSAGLNNALNAVNVAAWAFTVVAGLFFVSARNWEDGGFLPYGWSGVMRGAATCFYAFIGFDIIATTGEEARDPHGSIPYAVTASLLACLTAYVTVSAVLTLAVPYRLIDGSAPLMEMFAAHGFVLGRYVVAAGAVAGLTASLLGSLFPMPRVIYAMARDGLLFRPLGLVSASTRTPALACAVSGGLAAVLALLVSLADLIEMMSIGTLLAYTLVSACVLLLRYQPDEATPTPDEALGEATPTPNEALGEATPPPNEALGEATPPPEPPADGGDGQTGAWGDEGSPYHDGVAPPPEAPLLGGGYSALRRRLGMPEAWQRPTAASGRLVTRCTLLLFLTSFVLWSAVIFGVERGGGAAAGLAAALALASVLKLLLTILRQPQSGRSLAYTAPCVPFVPAAAVLVNSYLMLKLSALTWARFAVWCLAGLLVYGAYGMWNSSLEMDALERRAHASSYHRYDDQLDDGGEEPTYQGWAAPEEGGGGYQQSQYDGGGASQSGPGGQSLSDWSGGRTNRGFDEEQED